MSEQLHKVLEGRRCSWRVVGVALNRHSVLLLVIQVVANKTAAAAVGMIARRG
jgi:hypothetical protein